MKSVITLAATLILASCGSADDSASISPETPAAVVTTTSEQPKAVDVFEGKFRQPCDGYGIVTEVEHANFVQTVWKFNCATNQRWGSQPANVRNYSVTSDLGNGEYIMKITVKDAVGEERWILKTSTVEFFEKVQSVQKGEFFKVK